MRRRNPASTDPYAFRTHRCWCSLWTAGSAQCDCGQLDVEDLIAWHASRSRSFLVEVDRAAAAS